MSFEQHGNKNILTRLHENISTSYKKYIIVLWLDTTENLIYNRNPFVNFFYLYGNIIRIIDQ